MENQNSFPVYRGILSLHKRTLNSIVESQIHIKVLRISQKKQVLTMKKELISHEIAEDSIHFSAFSAKHGIYYSVETFFAFYAFSKKKKKKPTYTNMPKDWRTRVL